MVMKLHSNDILLLRMFIESPVLTLAEIWAKSQEGKDFTCSKDQLRSWCRRLHKEGWIQYFQDNAGLQISLTRTALLEILKPYKSRKEIPEQTENWAVTRKFKPIRSNDEFRGKQTIRSMLSR
jgi:hypothetical protein